MVSRDDHNVRLSNIIGWLQIAKENLPAISDGQVSADRVANASGLLDRLHTAAVGLQATLSAAGVGERAADRGADRTASDHQAGQTAQLGQAGQTAQAGQAGRHEPARTATGASSAHHAV